jgi:hypothetical protein
VIDAVGEVFGTHRATVREAITRLKERVVRLEAASNFEERFNRLAGEVKRGAEIPQSELLERIDALQRQVDLKEAADVDFREFADRVTELEKTNSLGERFSQLEHQLAARQKALLSQDELLAKIERLQRQIDDLKRVADLDVRFHEFVERIMELKKTNGLEARFNRLANEVKLGSEIPQGELLVKIEGLQRQLDELKRVADQPGPQGPPGPPCKLPCVNEYFAERVHYESDVVTHAGALWQARCDTVHAPPHADWVCLARAGRDAKMPRIRGTFKSDAKYEALDIVITNGNSFIAKKDAPGDCPGDGWQLLAASGKRGNVGERGPVGPSGRDGMNAETRVIRLEGWRIDPEKYAVVPQVLDGRQVIDGPKLELRRLFEQFVAEVGS